MILFPINECYQYTNYKIINDTFWMNCEFFTFMTLININSIDIGSIFVLEKNKMLTIISKNKHKSKYYFKCVSTTNGCLYNLRYFDTLYKQYVIVYDYNNKIICVEKLLKIILKNKIIFEPYVISLELFFQFFSLFIILLFLVISCFSIFIQ